MDVGMNLGCGEAVGEATADKEIVDTPPDISCAGCRTETPPAVGVAAVGIQIPEGVYESVVEQGGKTPAFLIRETGILMIGFGVGEVDFLMGAIEVAADDDGFLRIEFRDVFPEFVFPVHTVIETGKFCLRIRRIYVYKEKVFEFECEYAAFFVVTLDPNVTAHAQRVFTGEYGRAGIPLALGVIVIGFITFELQVYLAFLQFDFLETEKVGIQRGEYFIETFRDYGAQAVDIP